MRLRQRLTHPDTLAIIILILLWLLFFWRLFTPIAEDQTSLTQGDFSGQFVAFGAYQYERFAEGEIPLWNPYNNSGLPFMADTQAAVFYPPRLATVAISMISGGWSYNALQMEMVFHVLLYSLLMYLFLRRLTLEQRGSVFGSLIGAIVIAYGGYTTGYPALQLAVLEAALWLPLATLGILEATRGDRLGWRCLLVTGLALGISWMAGHPQTSFFLTYLLVAFFAYRVWVKHYGWRAFVLGTALFGGVSFGVTAVTLLPGAEYLLRTARSEMGFDTKGNGFPFQDVAQFLYPGSVSLWSPLYVGIPALIFVGIALLRRLPGALFWGSVALFALALSFGDDTVVHHVVYNIIPGERFFRGQERAAYLIANSLAILTGMGAAHLASVTIEPDSHFARRLRRAGLGVLGLCFVIAFTTFLFWQGDRQAYDSFAGIAFFSAIIAALTWGLLIWITRQPRSRIAFLLLAALVIFELFSVNIDNSNFDSIPASEQLTITPPPHIALVKEDSQNQPFRVDGFRGLQDNYGSLYGVMDMRGISPLFLTGPQRLIYRDYLDNPLAWELFAVKYVYSDRQNLSVDNTIIAEGSDREGVIQVRQLTDPRPFAHLVYDAVVLDSDEFAYALLNDPQFNPRDSIILLEDPGIDLPESAPTTATVTFSSFEPEHMMIEVNTAENAILSLAHPDYPGWHATLDGDPVSLMRAYGALTAIPVPAGEHTIELIYDPLSFRIGAILSLVTWVVLGILSLVFVFRRH